ncbi:MAG: glycosyl transferase family 28 [Phaeodactylibacter sp.]|uniref:glycosyl transferase family 28 n=1 Tax=Phaeodactylibacter sp. TaxID=1940289 RepID=UPI0032EBFF4F
MPNRPRILIACLDWGLGHAARSLPIADRLQALGAQPVLASAGAAGAFLQAERPDLEYIPLPAYAIHYRHSSMVANIAVQAPKLARVAWQEHRMIQRYIDEQQLSGIISDNRFGVFSDKVPSVFLTHQLRPIMPYPWLQLLTNRLMQVFVQRFQECWVPDLPDGNGLSGRLSHPPLAGMPTYYVGWLSRFTERKAEADSRPTLDSLSILSGPEPQRTHLEEALLAQLRQLPGQHKLVRGIPTAAPAHSVGSVQVHSYLKGARLWEEICRASVLIGRPGYSSLMDWGAAGKKALCIPTPGQTEQEYLAQRLLADGRIAVQQQGSLQLGEGIREARHSRGLSAPDSGSLLQQNLQRFLANLSVVSAG